MIGVGVGIAFHSVESVESSGFVKSAKWSEVRGVLLVEAGFE
jgi:hypothetical protein